MGDNFGIRAAAIAVAMVAIMMRVDDIIDGVCGRLGIGIGGCMVCVNGTSTKVSTTRLIAIDNQAGI